MDYSRAIPTRRSSMINSRMHSSRLSRQFKFSLVAYLAKNMNEKVISMLEGNSLAPGCYPAAGGALRNRLCQKRPKSESLAATENSRGRCGCRAIPFPMKLQPCILCWTITRRPSICWNWRTNRRESSIIFLNVDPLLLPLHSEPRFKTIAAKDQYLVAAAKERTRPMNR